MVVAAATVPPASHCATLPTTSMSGTGRERLRHAGDPQPLGMAAAAMPETHVLLKKRSATLLSLKLPTLMQFEPSYGITRTRLEWNDDECPPTGWGLYRLGAFGWGLYARGYRLGAIGHGL